MPDRVFVCRAGDVPSPPLGLRFELPAQCENRPALLVNLGGSRGLRAFYNRCAHMELELDWNPGVFFDAANRYLMCATHGALFDPDSGRCVAGPCLGAALVALPVTVVGERVLVDRPTDGQGDSRPKTSTGTKHE